MRDTLRRTKYTDDWYGRVQSKAKESILKIVVIEKKIVVMENFSGRGKQMPIQIKEAFRTPNRQD